MIRIWLVVLFWQAGVVSACPDVTPVPKTLGYPSPYKRNDPTKSQLDPIPQAEMQAALEVVDDPLRALARLADHLPDPAALACLTDHLRHWADADGLPQFWAAACISIHVSRNSCGQPKTNSRMTC